MAICLLAGRLSFLVEDLPDDFHYVSQRIWLLQEMESLFLDLQAVGPLYVASGVDQVTVFSEESVSQPSRGFLIFDK